MNSHFELLSCVFVNEGSSVDSVLFDFRWKRNRSENFGIISKSRIHDLLDRLIKNFRFVSPHSDTKFGSRFSRSGGPLSVGFAAGEAVLAARFEVAPLFLDTFFGAAAESAFFGLAV